MERSFWRVLVVGAAGRTLALGVLCGLSWPLSAADKSGVSPNSISLPKGPGAIEGLGESFQPSLNSGTAKYAINLKLPPGTAGHAPNLSLSYEGGSGNGPLGFGWMLPMPAVQRRSDKGIPSYGENVGFSRQDVFITESREELVPLASGDYFCKNEGAFIRYRQLSNHWEGTTPLGTLMVFGASGTARIEDSASSSNHIFAWLLERQTDTHGNTIVYGYTNFSDPNDLNQKYLESIAYGPGPPPWNNFHFVEFIYEDRPDWFEDCRAGFQVRTGKRLKEIVIGTQGPVLTNHLAGDFNRDGSTDYLDRKYVLEYLAYAGTNSHWSLLARVTLIGADGLSSLPPASFGYQVCNPPPALSAAGQIIGGNNEPPLVMDDSSIELLDLNGDGLPDLLKTDPGGGSHTGYINRGEVNSGSEAAINWESGSGVDSADGQAWLYNLQSTAPIAHLADMDGDGLADLAVTALDGSVFYFSNRGRLGWGPRQDMSVQDTAPPSPFANSSVRTADLDFDKRIDVIESVSSGGGADYRIWFNLGNQNYSSALTVAQNWGFLFSDAGVQIADLNGDRVPDVARVQPSLIMVTAGLGYGRFADPVTVAIPDVVLGDTQASRATLEDINGDGLADLVLERAAPGELWYWLNLGNYTLDHLKVITGMPTSISGTAVTRWADLNGNGTTDLIYADSSAMPKLQTIDLGLLLNGGLTPNLLVAISNGIGRVTLVGYAASTSYATADATAGKPWPDLMPNPVQVISSITTLDSLGHQYVTQFRYHNGYYDPVEKQFRGFGEAEQVDVGDPTAPTLVTRSFFDTGRAYESMKGKLLAVSLEQEDGSVFSVETNVWLIPPQTLYTGTNGTNVVFAHPAGTTKVISERDQGAPRRLETEVAFDQYGNQTTNAEYGIVENGDRSAFQDERITVTEYALNTNAWLLRYPYREEVHSINSVISRVEQFYDDETFSGNNPGSVAIGNLTMKRSWITPSNATAYIISARTKYDAFGNPLAVMDPLGVAPGGTIDVSQGHLRTIGYDTRFHTFPISETIQVGGATPALLAQALYDEGLAVGTTVFDFNTNQTYCSYDAFGRLTAVVRPYDSPAFPTVEYDYVLAVPFGTNELVNYVETRERDVTEIKNPKSAMYLFSRQFSDGLGRKLMFKHEAEPETKGGPPRVVVENAVQFNARAKAFQELNPYYSQAGADLATLLGFEDIRAPGWTGMFQVGTNLAALDFSAADKSTTVYDATLRPVARTNQDGTYHRTVYEPLVIRSYDENQSDPSSPFYLNNSAQYRDGLGRIMQSDLVTALNNDGTRGVAKHTWTTRFEHDPNDNLTRITDSQNNVKVLEFDGLKRKTFMNDPDRGTMTYLYDDASNLRESIDAKGQHITRQYDGANRLLTETYVGSALSPRLGEDRGEGMVNVAYHYDTPAGLVDNGDGTKSSSQNTRGFLSFVSDGAGEEHTSYDERGRVQAMIKRIPDPVLVASGSTTPSAVLTAFRTTFEYDSMDRITRMVYPDNDQITYSYNERGVLAGIPGGPNGSVLTNLVYSPAGDQQQVSFGNGVQTRCGYDSRLRLSSLITYQPGRPTDPLIHFDYSFDNVSNLKRISDQRPFSALSILDPRRNSQALLYDDLYRLTRVSYNAPSADPQTATNFIRYRYDRLGNTLEQRSDVAAVENGFSLTDLGAMDYGGALGSSNRVGRLPGDPPGPHALSTIRAPALERNYPYDANGNLVVLDGLTNTWDFKDRLVTTENAAMRADYTYDAADRRISKLVTLKPIGTNASATSTSILYVSDSFEIRDHDAPTKYIFNGHTRVAHVVGSLSQNLRLQRWRVFPGWNLCSLAVSVTNLVSQLSEANPSAGISSVYLWDVAASNFVPVLSGTTVAAGSVLWLHGATNGIVSVMGSYTEPSNALLARGGNFIASAGLESWPVSNLFPATTSAMKWIGPAAGWDLQLGPPLAPGAPRPYFIAPGEAVFVQAPAAAQLETPPANLRIRYYHPDHLGSCTVMTDARADLVEETAYFPFGAPRNRWQPAGVADPYGFTRKERDAETGLIYFGKRFYSPALGKWLSTDPMQEKSGSMNLYEYVHENPFKYEDPDGGEIKIIKDPKGEKIAKGHHLYVIEVKAVLINLSPKLKDAGWGRKEAEEFSKQLAATIESAYKGENKREKTSWKTKVDIKVIDSMDEVKEASGEYKGDHVFRLVDNIWSGGWSGTRGAAGHGYKWMEIRAGVILKPDGHAENTGAHELGHSGGLDHDSGNDPNLMRPGGVRADNETAITLKQIEQMYQQYQAGRLNQGSSKLGSWEAGHQGLGTSD